MSVPRKDNEKQPRQLIPGTGGPILEPLSQAIQVSKNDRQDSQSSLGSQQSVSIGARLSPTTNNQQRAPPTANSLPQVEDKPVSNVDNIERNSLPNGFPSVVIPVSVTLDPKQFKEVSLNEVASPETKEVADSIQPEPKTTKETAPPDKNLEPSKDKNNIRDETTDKQSKPVVLPSLEIKKIPFDSMDQEEVFRLIDEKVKVVCDVFDRDITFADVSEEIGYVYSATRFLGDKVKVTKRGLRILEAGYGDMYVKLLNATKASDEVGYLFMKGSPHARWSFIRISGTVWNASDKGPEICRVLINKSLLPVLFDALKSELLDPTDSEVLKNNFARQTVKALLGMFHNIVQHVGVEYKAIFQDYNAVSVIQKYLESTFLIIKTKAVLILSYIVSEDENDKLNASDANVSFILGILKGCVEVEGHHSKKSGFWAGEVLSGLNKMAVNESNKEKIVRLGALPLYVQCMEEGKSNEEEHLQACKGVWTLAFNDENKAKIKEEPGLMQAIERLSSESPNEDVRKAALGALWVILERSKSHWPNVKEKLAEKDKAFHEIKEDHAPHVMISYNWGSQPMMIKVRDQLIKAGYNVWMDIDHISGSILEAMAEAIEKAAVVLICFSEKYKASPNCRTEAEYAFQRRRDIIPIRVQKRYFADGWLGALIGTKLFFDVTDDEKYRKIVPQIIAELGGRGRVGGVVDTVDRAITAPVSYSAPRQSSDRPQYATWSEVKVKDWLVENRIPSDVISRLEGIDGPLLFQMKKMFENSPEFFYTTLRSELSCNLVTTLRVTDALDKLPWTAD